MAGIEVRVHSDVAQFAALTMPALMRFEAINQIMLGMLNNAHDLSAPFEYLFSVHRDGQVVGAATKNRGPQFKLLISPLDAAELAALTDIAMGVLPATLFGVLGANDNVEAFAAAWKNRYSVSLRIEHHFGVLACSQMIAPPTTPGHLRTAGPNDFARMLEWRREFIRDCRLEPESPAEATAATERGIARKSLLIWEAHGAPVSMLSANSGTPNGGRIGLVYTPPALRGKNYASAAVAAATQRFFAEGKKFSFLNTDLSNPISNKIYERIGYVRVSDSLAIAFDSVAP